MTATNGEGAQVTGYETTLNWRRPNGPAEEGTPSPQAVPAVTRALRRFRDEDQKMFRHWEPGDLPFALKYHGYLDRIPHYLEVVEALGNLGIVYGFGTSERGIARTAEDLRREYLHGEYTGTLYTKNPDGTWEPGSAYGPYVIGRPES